MRLMRTSARSSRLRTYLAVALVVAAASVIPMVGSAFGYSAPSLNYIDPGATQEDEVYNYDFQTTTVANNNVGWPVDIMFVNNATVATTQNDLCNWVYIYGGGCGGGITEYSRLADYAPSNTGCTTSCLTWRGASGIKSNPCGNNYFGQADADLHVRVYAPDGVRLLNQAVGYYTIGTSHLDSHDSTSCPGYSVTGYSEAVEYEVFSEWQSHASAWYNTGNTYTGRNALTYGWSGNALLWNDGWLTWLQVL